MYEQSSVTGCTVLRLGVPGPSLVPDLWQNPEQNPDSKYILRRAFISTVVAGEPA